MDLSQYQFSFGVHHQKNVIWIRFEYSILLKNNLKSRFPSAKWSPSNKAWYLPDFPSIREQLNLKIKVGENEISKINRINLDAYLAYKKQLQLKAYSENTQKVYLSEFSHLLSLIGDFPVENLTPEKLKNYFYYCVDQLKMKERKMNGKINAIKFYYEKVLHQPKMFFDIPRPKKPISLPKMLTPREIKILFGQIHNIKHLLALQLSYGMGLRVSEVVNLKWEHINSRERMVLIANSKGKKDRYVPLPESILPLLKNYYQKYHPKEYVLEGQYGGKYSKASVQHIFKSAMQKAGINKQIGVHGLRHSYATHLLQSGVDIRFIQDLLGHHSIKTTMVYTHVAPKELQKIKSPLDYLES